MNFIIFHYFTELYTYIAMMTQDSPSTIFKLYELVNDTYVKEFGNYLEIVSKKDASKYKSNMSEYFKKLRQVKNGVNPYDYAKG